MALEAVEGLHRFEGFVRLPDIPSRAGLVVQLDRRGRRYATNYYQSQQVLERHVLMLDRVG